MPFAIPMVGAAAARRTANREFKLGTAQLDDSNQTWVYVQASEAVATGTQRLRATRVTTRSPPSGRIVRKERSASRRPRSAMPMPICG